MGYRYRIILNYNPHLMSEARKLKREFSNEFKLWLVRIKVQCSNVMEV